MRRIGVLTRVPEHRHAERGELHRRLEDAERQADEGEAGDALGDRQHEVGPRDHEGCSQGVRHRENDLAGDATRSERRVHRPLGPSARRDHDMRMASELFERELAAHRGVPLAYVVGRRSPPEPRRARALTSTDRPAGVLRRRMAERHHRTCNLCEALCGMIVTVDAGRVTDVRGDPDDVFSRGHICPKGPAMRELQEDPDRLRHPVRRTPTGFVRIGWEEAFDEVASRLHEVQSRHGRHAVGTYIGNPTVHNHGAILMSQALLAALGSKHRFDANSQDANPKLYAALKMFGELTSITVPDIDRTEFLLMLGANPVASGGSIMTLGDVRGRLRGVRERGARFVLVDPRRTETAALADEHLAIRPGGDAALLLAMMHVLFAEGLVDQAKVSAIAEHADRLREATEPYPPELVAGPIGIEAAKIRELTRAFARAPSAVAYGRIGICHGEFGAVASWLTEALNVVTGNFDRPGGAMFPKPAIDLSAVARRLGLHGTGRFRSRVRGLPELGGMLPAATIAEEIETEGDGQIRAMVTLAGNPVLSVPGGERLAKAFGKLDFMVSIDLYVNETTRHAHVILPPRYALERGHYDLVFHALAVRNTAKWSEPVLPPEPDTREDWDILYELAARLAAGRIGVAPLERATRWLAKRARFSPDRAIDLLLRLGPYPGLSLAKLRAAPHGIDLGPLVPMGRERVRSKTGLVDLAPEPLVADVPRVGRWLAAGRSRELVLIGRRHMRSNNSWMHNVHSLTKGPDRATLMMHPDDARRLGLLNGRPVRMTTGSGAVQARLEVTPDMLPGVVSLPHGFGHAAAKDTLRIAGALPGPSFNAISDERRVEPLTGTAILTGLSVTVEPVAEEMDARPT